MTEKRFYSPESTGEVLVLDHCLPGWEVHVTLQRDPVHM